MSNVRDRFGPYDPSNNIISRTAEYSSGPTRFWDMGGDTHDMFSGGADFLQEVVLSLDESELDALINDLQTLENEAD
jgi:hypothetical protein